MTTYTDGTFWNVSKTRRGGLVDYNISVGFYGENEEPLFKTFIVKDWDTVEDILTYMWEESHLTVIIDDIDRLHQIKSKRGNIQFLDGKVHSCTFQMRNKPLENDII